VGTEARHRTAKVWASRIFRQTPEIHGTEVGTEARTED
jgi:hypothetical protein